VADVTTRQQPAGAVDNSATAAELVKSKQRVADHGEVFTPN
jgi:hypothetical protein